MQAEIRWTPPQGPLGRLSEKARVRAAALSSTLAEWRSRARDAAPAPSFADALAHGDYLALIAEIKRESPSKGVINAAIVASERGAMYARAGASALSVLTEPTEFGGRNEDLVDVRRSVAIPILKKDFHVHASQLWEARALGASAALLIARALPPGELARLVDVAHEAGIEVLVEVRSESELRDAVDCGARVIGVNARDLETLVIDPAVTARILPLIPRDRVRVAESGIASTDDVARVAALGADAVLVGSSLSAAGDPASTARAIASVPRLRAS